ncbi:MlaE family ABC transporter permease [Orrella marina]|uniref:ABC transporter permease n=1 Tax=Orrella marina TaxID=2163011 RepID=A0A2R4XLC8_9BURK|nr:ABC transporter permease [Orrella marina]AWB34592.1 ABC transporter permease [Orrella marina]
MKTAKSESFISRTDSVCTISGRWDVAALSSGGEVARRRRELKAVKEDMRWELDEQTRLDTVGAQLLWDRWGHKVPDGLELTAGQKDLFRMLAMGAQQDRIPKQKFDPFGWIEQIGRGAGVAYEHGVMLLTLLGRLAFDMVGFLARPHRGPWKEISAQVFRAGAQALGITALVGFLIGVVISYLSAQQLAMFGAGQFIVTLLGVSIVRELGPVLAAILVAGRSGSAITAQIGVMRVTQELDAMDVMGISQSQRLILPRVIALALVMPLLVLWTDALALFGGMIAAKYELGLQMAWFFEQLPRAVGLKNFWIGTIKGVTFGAWVALVACHFGLRIEPNTESLGKGTTTSVVTAITGVILIDAIYAVIFSQMGI